MATILANLSNSVLLILHLHKWSGCRPRDLDPDKRQETDRKKTISGHLKLHSICEVNAVRSYSFALSINLFIIDDIGFPEQKLFIFFSLSVEFNWKYVNESVTIQMNLNINASLFVRLLRPTL